MQDCETINLNEYTLSGEGGTAITYKHNSRNSLAKLYNNGFDAERRAITDVTHDCVFSSEYTEYKISKDGKKAECLAYVRDVLEKYASGKYVKYLKSEKDLRQYIPDFKERVEAFYTKYGK